MHTVGFGDKFPFFVAERTMIIQIGGTSQVGGASQSFIRRRSILASDPLA